MSNASAPLVVEHGVLAAVDLGSLQLDQSISVWNVVFAVLAVIATLIVGRLVQRGVLGLLTRVPTVGEDARRLMARVVKYFVWGVGAGVAVSFLGAQVQPLLAAALIVALVAALVMRGVAENFGAGLVIQTRKAVQIGDAIESLGYTGTVIAVNGRAVVLETIDGHTVHLPNAEVLKHPIVNDPALGRRRADIEVRVATDVAAIDTVTAAVRDALTASAAIDQTITPAVTTAAVEPRRLTLRIRVWHEPSSPTLARSQVMHEIARALAGRQLDFTLQAPPPVAPSTPPPTL